MPPSPRASEFATGCPSARRQRGLAAVSVGVAALTGVLVVLALVARGQAADGRAAAVRSGDRARMAAGEAASRALAILSGGQLARDPELAVILAKQALVSSPTPDAQRALRNALDASPLLATVAATGGTARRTAGSTVTGSCSRPTLGRSPRDPATASST